MDMHTHADSTLHNSVTLTFGYLTSGSMHAKGLPYSIYTKFGTDSCSSHFSFRAQTHRQTQSHRRHWSPLHASTTAEEQYYWLQYPTSTIRYKYYRHLCSNHVFMICDYIKGVIQLTYSVWQK